MNDVFDIRNDGLTHGFHNQLSADELSRLRRQLPERVVLVSRHISGSRLREVYAAVEEVLGIEPGGLVYPYVDIPNDVRMPMLHRNSITLSLTGLSQDEICTRLGMDRHTASRIFSHVPYQRYIETKRMGAMAGLMEANLGMKELVGEAINVMRQLLRDGKEDTRAKLAMAIMKGMPQFGVDASTGVSAESGATLKGAASDAVGIESEQPVRKNGIYEPLLVDECPGTIMQMKCPSERELTDTKYLDSMFIPVDDPILSRRINSSNAHVRTQYRATLEKGASTYETREDPSEVHA